MQIAPSDKKLLLPVDLAQFAYGHKLGKALAIYCYLKLHCDGKIGEDHAVFQELREMLCLTDDRSFRKHMKLLIEHNWIGHDPVAKMYFVRKTDYIRVRHHLRGRQAVEVFLKDLLHFRVFLAAIIITKEVTDAEFYWDVVLPRRLRKVPAKRAGATHSSTSSDTRRPAYYGLCNHRIATLLGCKKTRACQLKQQAAELGYIELHHRYQDLLVLDKGDFAVRAQLYEQYPVIKGRIRCWRKWTKNGQKYIKLLLQLHDQIISRLRFKRIQKLSAVRLPVAVTRQIERAA